MKFTPEKITSLEKDEVFVFGSNLDGNHLGGAARMAKLSFGAKDGNPEGLQGDSYAIPTVSKGLKRILKPEEIKPYVDNFITFASKNVEKKFLVTEIGCGIAGMQPKQIAPLFKEALHLSNVILPMKFHRVLRHIIN